MTLRRFVGNNKKEKKNQISLSQHDNTSDNFVVPWNETLRILVTERSWKQSMKQINNTVCMYSVFPEILRFVYLEHYIRQNPNAFQLQTTSDRILSKQKIKRWDRWTHPKPTINHHPFISNWFRLCTFFFLLSLNLNLYVKKARISMH